jgi:D-xylose reductase
MHHYLTQQRLLNYCRGENIAVTAFSPLGADSYIPLDMAEKKNGCWPTRSSPGSRQPTADPQPGTSCAGAVRRGTVPIPRSQSLAHLEENLAIHDFDLTEEEMRHIDSLA